MGYLTSWGFIIDFLILDAGVLIGWCLRVALTRAQQNLPDAGYRPTLDNSAGVPLDGTGSIARWP